jgi:hypothetical protein
MGKQIHFRSHRASGRTFPALITLIDYRQQISSGTGYTRRR